MAERAVGGRGRRKRYGEPSAADGLDLGIRHGEVVGFLGPNGAGKGTTVEIPQGHRCRDAGTVSAPGAGPAAVRRSDPAG